MKNLTIHPNDLIGLSTEQQNRLIGQLQVLGHDVKIDSVRERQTRRGGFEFLSTFVDDVRRLRSAYETGDENILVASFGGWQLEYPRSKWESMTVAEQTDAIIAQYFLFETSRRNDSTHDWLVSELKTEMVKTAVLHVWNHLPAEWFNQMMVQNVRFIEVEMEGLRGEAEAVCYKWATHKPVIKIDPRKSKSVAMCCEIVLHEVIHTVFQHVLLASYALESERPYIVDATERMTRELTSQLLPSILEDLPV